MGELVRHNFGHPAPMLTKAQLAQHLGRSTRWVEERVKDGMPSKMGTRRNRSVRLFPLYDVESWLGNTKGDSDGKAAQFAVRS